MYSNCRLVKVLSKFEAYCNIKLVCFAQTDHHWPKEGGNPAFTEKSCIYQKKLEIFPNYCMLTTLYVYIELV